MVMRERLLVALDAYREMLPVARANAIDPRSNSGASLGLLKGLLRDLGVSEFIVDGNVESFKANLVEASRYMVTVFERYDSGEQISPSYVSMLAFKDLFDCLAAGDMNLAKSIASHMGGRDAVEKEHDHPFDHVMGYTLRAFVLGESENMSAWLMKLTSKCEQPRDADFIGYCIGYKAILDADVSAASRGLETIVIGHKKQSKGRGVFKSTPDEGVSVW